MLFIPESRKRPITESLLYKQIIRFLHEERIEGYFDIVFISIADGVVEAKKSDGWNYQKSKVYPHTNSGIASETRKGDNATIGVGVKLPPKNFRSGRSWISKKVKMEMAENITKYLYGNGNKYNTKIAYVRGSYLEAVRLASEKSGIKIQEIFTEEELAMLRKRGMKWMKVGLRMPEAFTIFRQRIKEFTQNEHRQLKLPM